MTADKTFTSLKPAALDMLADETYARRRDEDLTRSMSADAERPAGRRVIRRRPSLLLTGVAAACTVAAGGVVVATGQQDPPARQTTPAPRRSTGPGDARQVLLASAHAAEKAPFGSGRYWYNRQRSTGLMAGYRTVVKGKGSKARKVRQRMDYRAHLVTLGEVWVPRAQGDVGRKTNGPAKVVFPTAADQARHKADGSPLSVAPGKPSVWQGRLLLGIGNRKMTVKELAGLPTDTHRLNALLRAQYQRDLKDSVNRYQGSFRGFVWGIAHDLLAGPISPGTKGALFKVMAGLPGVRLVGEVKDQLGRPGVAVTATGPEGTGATRVEDRLIISPETGRLLAYEVREGNDRFDSTTYETMGWVDALGGRP